MVGEIPQRPDQTHLVLYNIPPLRKSADVFFMFVFLLFSFCDDLLFKDRNMSLTACLSTKDGNGLTACFLGASVFF